jgi:molybdate transport system substrate-binding protein
MVPRSAGPDLADRTSTSIGPGHFMIVERFAGAGEIGGDPGVLLERSRRRRALPSWRSRDRRTRCGRPRRRSLCAFVVVDARGDGQRQQAARDVRSHPVATEQLAFQDRIARIIAGGRRRARQPMGIDLSTGGEVPGQRALVGDSPVARGDRYNEMTAQLERSERLLLGYAAMMRFRSGASIAVLLAFAPACKKNEAQGTEKESIEGEVEPETSGAPLRVAGAANLAKVMEEIVPRFEKESGAKVDFIPGSSGKIAAQIKEGAPFDLFMAANVKFADEAIASGECLSDSKRIYARGRVVMWTKDEAAGALPANLDGLVEGKYETIALAQPDQAPYGAAAKAALEKLGVWSKIEKRLIYGTNIEDTMKMAETGSAEVALIALSQAIKSKGKYVEIPEELHPPLDQALAVCKNGKQQALGVRFAEFIATPEIQELMKSYGYTIP